MNAVRMVDTLSSRNLKTENLLDVPRYDFFGCGDTLLGKVFLSKDMMFDVCILCCRKILGHFLMERCQLSTTFDL